LHAILHLQRPALAAEFAALAGLPRKSFVVGRYENVGRCGWLVLVALLNQAAPDTNFRAAAGAIDFAIWSGAKRSALGERNVEIAVTCGKLEFYAAWALSGFGRGGSRSETLSNVTAQRDVRAAKHGLWVGEIYLAGLGGRGLIGGSGGVLRSGDRDAEQRHNERTAREQSRSVT
jgi:hypothetical protein